MRWAITGAAGFIGSHLAETLIAAGDDVVAIDCFTDYYDPALKEENAASFPVGTIDLAVDALDLHGLDGVFHLAGRPGVRSFGDVFPDYLRDNVLATQRLLEAAATAGTRVVFASSSSVYGEAETYPTPESTAPAPRSPYGITKLACEQLASAYRAAFGLDVVVLRYFTVYGPRQRPDMLFARVADSLAGGAGLELSGDGSQSRSFTYVGDVVRATVDAMARAPSGSLYNVGGGEEATVNETIALLEGIAGRRAAVTRGPRTAGDVTRTKADTSRIRDELGWMPAVPLEDGLRAQWEWVAARAARTSAA